MFGGDLDVFQHTFADRHARHDDDELLETVLARQLEDRPQVNVGLTGARLHLNGEMRTLPGRVGGCIEEFPRFQFRRGIVNFDVVAVLDQPGVVLQLVGSQEQIVADAQFGPRLAGE